jgi:hypothetical protein
MATSGTNPGLPLAVIHTLSFLSSSAKVRPDHSNHAMMLRSAAFALVVLLSAPAALGARRAASRRRPGQMRASRMAAGAHRASRMAAGPRPCLAQFPGPCRAQGPNALPLPPPPFAAKVHNTYGKMVRHPKVMSRAAKPFALPALRFRKVGFRSPGCALRRRRVALRRRRVGARKAGGAGRRYGSPMTPSITPPTTYCHVLSTTYCPVHPVHPVLAPASTLPRAIMRFAQICAQILHTAPDECSFLPT